MWQKTISAVSGGSDIHGNVQTLQLSPTSSGGQPVFIESPQPVKWAVFSIYASGNYTYFYDEYVSPTQFNYSSGNAWNTANFSDQSGSGWNITWEINPNGQNGVKIQSKNSTITHGYVAFCYD